MNIFATAFGTYNKNYDRNSHNLRAEYMQNLLARRKELADELELVDADIQEQEEKLRLEEEEIVATRQKAMCVEADLLEEQAAILRERADEVVVVKPTKTASTKKKVIPSPKPGQNITMTSEDLTIVELPTTIAINDNGVASADFNPLTKALKDVMAN